MPAARLKKALDSSSLRLPMHLGPFEVAGVVILMVDAVTPAASVQ